MKLPATGTPVRVEWLDTTSEPGWHYRLENEVIDSQPRLQITRGVLMAIGKEAIVISSTISPRGQLDLKEGFMDPLIVPKGCITKIQEIP